MMVILSGLADTCTPATHPLWRYMDETPDTPPEHVPTVHHGTAVLHATAQPVAEEAGPDGGDRPSTSE